MKNAKKILMAVVGFMLLMAQVVYASPITWDSLPGHHNQSILLKNGETSSEDIIAFHFSCPLKNNTGCRHCRKHADRHNIICEPFCLFYFVRDEHKKCSYSKADTEYNAFRRHGAETI